MRRNLYAVTVLVFTFIFFIGCAGPDSSSYKKKVEKVAQSSSVQSYSKPGTTLKGNTVGFVPFDCTVPYIGQTISDNTVKSLKDLNLIMIDAFEITQRVKRNGGYYHDLMKNKDYRKIMVLAELDNLMVGDVQVVSVHRKRILSATAYILDDNGDMVVKAKFEPPSGRWKMPAVAAVLADAIKSELEK